MKPGKHQRIKHICQDLYGRSAIVHNLLFCAHTLCLNNVTAKSLIFHWLVPQCKQLLCFVHGQGQTSEQKNATKKFVGLNYHSPLSTV